MVNKTDYKEVAVYRNVL